MHPGGQFVLGAGALATIMALRPLGVVRLLARYAVWVALVAVVYLFVQVLTQPLPAQPQAGHAVSFWAAVDVVIALPVSWAPLAADYTRHVRSARAAGVGAGLGYGAATIAFFSLGVLALVAYGAGGLDVIDALLAVPLGALALLVLVVRTIRMSPCVSRPPQSRGRAILTISSRGRTLTRDRPSASPSATSWASSCSQPCQVVYATSRSSR